MNGLDGFTRIFFDKVGIKRSVISMNFFCIYNKKNEEKSYVNGLGITLIKQLTVVLSFLCLISCENPTTTSTSFNDYSWIDMKERMETLNLQLENIWIHISKTDYALSLMHDTTRLKTYPVVFGGNPIDDKLREGDKCTPEGTFFIRNKYPHKKWTKFMWINYPTEASYENHKQAKAEGIIPQDASIGGEVGIHGCPVGTDPWIPKKHNWTLGCISMRNADIIEVYNNTAGKTKVVIEK